MRDCAWWSKRPVLETFSHTLGRLIEGGMLVELDGNRLEIRDRPRLAQLAAGLPLGLP